MATDCPRCAEPMEELEGESYFATHTFSWKDDNTPIAIWDFKQVITFGCNRCRLTCICPLTQM